MSAEPPSGPPPPPLETPPPSANGEAALPRLPWEDRERLGYLDALIETVRLLFTAPTDAFSRLRSDGDLVWPLVFGLLFSWFGQIFSQIWSLLFDDLIQSMMSGLSSFGAEFEPVGSSVLVAAGFVVFWPILFLIVILINAGVSHLCLMVLGATSESPTGFEGTLKVLCYGQVANLAMVVPFLGGLVALIVSVVLWVIGFAAVHRTSQVQALLAVLLAIFVCCVCCIVSFAGIGFIAGFAAAMAGG